MSIHFIMVINFFINFFLGLFETYQVNNIILQQTVLYNTYNKLYNIDILSNCFTYTYIHICI